MLTDVFYSKLNSNQYISANTIICHLYITSIDALSSFEFNPPYSPISQTSPILLSSSPTTPAGKSPPSSRFCSVCRSRAGGAVQEFAHGGNGGECWGRRSSENTMGTRWRVCIYHSAPSETVLAARLVEIKPCIL